MPSVLPKLIAASFLTLSLGACAQGARSTAMVAPVQAATLLPAESPLASSTQVGSVTGGEETNELWTSEISSASFRDALEQSLKLNTILGGEASPLTVDAQLISVEQPLFGLEMTVTTVAVYTVKNASGNTVFNERITTPYTAEFSDAFLGAERLRLANEGSAKANISSFIEKLVNAANANPSVFRSGLTS